VEPLRVAPDLVIPVEDLRVRFTRASGPGGQNVNKVATRATLRFDLAGSRALPPAVRARLETLAANRMTRRGHLLLSSDRYRDQGRNLADCRQRLAALIRRALTPPKVRRPTRPGKAAAAKRLTEKRQLGARKRERQRPAAEED
jgi:ribosome-associated protein